jgi:hypothetical protein
VCQLPTTLPNPAVVAVVAAVVAAMMKTTTITVIATNTAKVAAAMAVAAAGEIPDAAVGSRKRKWHLGEKALSTKHEILNHSAALGRGNLPSHFPADLR